MLTNQRLILVSLGLIVLINAGALLGTWHNQGASTSALVLSERELTRHYRGNAYALRWQYPNEQHSVSQAQRETLMQGCQARCQQRQDVFAVLELEGALYQSALAQAKLAIDKANQDPKQLSAAQNALEALTQQSRLYLVAVGKDAKALRQRYPDATQYAVVSAQFTPSPATNEHYYGALQLTHPRIYASKRQLQNTANCQLKAQVMWGKRYIPWLGELSCKAT